MVKQNNRFIYRCWVGEKKMSPITEQLEGTGAAKAARRESDLSGYLAKSGANLVPRDFLPALGDQFPTLFYGSSAESVGV